jgi:hypothetical protein
LERRDAGGARFPRNSASRFEAAVTGAFLALLLLSNSASNPPIPDGSDMKQRVLKSLRQSEKALENYSCIVRDQSDEFKSDGSTKRHRSSVKEQFFVNQVQIDHTLERDGKPLNPSEAKKEQEKVDKEVKKYSDPEQAQKLQAHDEKQADIFLRALQLTHGKREQRAGRNTLVYDLSGDPHFHPKKLEERFAQALVGTIAIDEQSGTPVDIRFETTRDVKIGAGLLANLHKGFWLHVVQQREPDGVWLTKEVRGSGDARAALFMRARFQFQEELDKCHLFSVNTQQKISGPGESR